MPDVRALPVHLIEPAADDPRTELFEIDELAETIDKHGLLQAIVVVENGSTFTLVAGHRRLEAVKKLGWDLIDANVIAVDDAVDALSATLAENTARQELSALERARGYQSMFAHGVKPKEIARRTGRPLAEIELAKELGDKVAAVPEKVAEATAVKQTSLPETIAIAEFSDDEEVSAKLLDVSGTGQFAHVLEQERQKRDRREKAARCRAELERLGVKEIDQQKAWAPSCKELRHLHIKPEDHASCPGHAGLINHSGGIDYYCTRASLHDPAAKPEGGGLSEAEKQRRRDMREGKKLWRAADVVRLEHLKRAIAMPVKAMLPFAAGIAWAEGFERYGCGIQRRFTEELVAGRRVVKPEARLFALAAGEVERTLTGLIEQTGGVKVLEKSAHYAENLRTITAYYAVLEETGYVLAECEQALVAQSDGKPPKHFDEDAPYPVTMSAKWGPIANGQQTGTFVRGDQSAVVSITQAMTAFDKPGFELVVDGEHVTTFAGNDFEMARLHTEGWILELFTTGRIELAVDGKSAAAGEQAPKGQSDASDFDTCRQGEEPETAPINNGAKATPTDGAQEQTDGETASSEEAKHTHASNPCSPADDLRAAPGPNVDEIDFENPRISAVWATEIPHLVSQLPTSPQTFHWMGVELYEIALTEGVLMVSTDSRRPCDLVIADLRELLAEMGSDATPTHAGRMPADETGAVYDIYEAVIVT